MYGSSLGFLKNGDNLDLKSYFSLRAIKHPS